ncbi:hypothetical protein LPB41_14725 [Thalassospira sp. MA62]|nr:hypothetical protein [Thalassospira sp. MA62]
MTRKSSDPIDQAIDEIESRSWARKLVFGIAVFCLASCLLGLFFLVTRLIVPSGFF